MNKLFTNAILRLVDFILAIFSIPAALVLRCYRRVGSQRLPLTSDVLKKIGVFPIRDHYYEPLFNDRLLKKPLAEKRKLPGLALNTQEQLALVSGLAYAEELKRLNLDTASELNLGFHMANGVFGAGDADFLYQILRTIKPARLIEIGCGYSTRIAALALAANAREGRRADHICIEPYEAAWLDSFDNISLLRKGVENCGLDWAGELQAGDMLFIDSSHMIRPQGDVLEEYLNIIPQLATGVYVHVHDIFSPRDYPEKWVKDHVFFWNEQYLLEALLSNASRYEVVAGLNYLFHDHFDTLQAACPYLDPETEPGSFYFRVK